MACSTSSDCRIGSLGREYKTRVRGGVVVVNSCCCTPSAPEGLVEMAAADCLTDDRFALCNLSTTLIDAASTTPSAAVLITSKFTRLSADLKRSALRFTSQESLAFSSKQTIIERIGLSWTGCLTFVWQIERTQHVPRCQMLQLPLPGLQCPGCPQLYPPGYQRRPAAK
jgi:hypothetical protein